MNTATQTERTYTPEPTDNLRKKLDSLLEGKQARSLPSDKLIGRRARCLPVSTLFDLVGNHLEFELMGTGSGTPAVLGLYKGDWSKEEKNYFDDLALLWEDSQSTSRLKKPIKLPHVSDAGHDYVVFLMEHIKEINAMPIGTIYPLDAYLAVKFPYTADRPALVIVK